MIGETESSGIMILMPGNPVGETNDVGCPVSVSTREIDANGKAMPFVVCVILYVHDVMSGTRSLC